MNILILGSGGREHALAWAIKQNPKCDRLICAPGNAGIDMIADCASFDILDGGVVRDFCVENAIDFVVIGPEAVLVSGVADKLRAAGILTFGPSQVAAELEASKSFTKEICTASGAPTAAYARFTDANAASDYVRAQGAPIVIKADGLAAGKGVVVAMDIEAALAAVADMFDRAFGEAGTAVVIEEFMDGEEASLFVLCNGENCLAMGSAQDHKRVFEGDKGPNTGGMGAYSPALVMTPELEAEVMDQMIRPTLKEMVRRGTPFQGILFAGLMIKGDAARLVEYNVRFGDPECQVLAMRLGAQVLDLLLACSENRLDETRVLFADDHALTVVMAARGYPRSYNKGSVIDGLASLTSSSFQEVFHAGTALENNAMTAIGGRVLNVTARGENLKAARDLAYEAVDKIDWPEGFCRRDIGWRAL
ncbi:MAG: phosphoribosylamine--glycine ligase [Paracoccaceae bacterium]|jgi:phosphoribosylamine--glycine ligase